MEGVNKILENITLPEFYKVKYETEAPSIDNIVKYTSDIIIESGLLSSVYKGMKIAVTVGSRGIANQKAVFKALVSELKKKGAFPFIIPAMGSHAGATAEGQKKMLEVLGFSEEETGVPIKASMDVVEIGKTEKGVPVYIDKNAYNADGIILLNRIKAHPSFKGPVESGLLKMAVIGLGKQKGAEICHTYGFETMSERIMKMAQVTLKKMPVLFAIGLIDNSHHETAEIHILPAERIEEKEPALLKRAKELMAVLPFKELDVLIIDQIGKDISGTGFDTNVVGRYHTGIGEGGPSVKRISILDITDYSHGNGNGLGIADFTTQRAFKKFNFAETYPNGLTSNVPISVKIPMVLSDDKQAVQAGMKTSNLPDITKAKIARIKDTLSINEFEISETLLNEIKKNDRITVIEGPYFLPFDSSGNLF